MLKLQVLRIVLVFLTIGYKKHTLSLLLTLELLILLLIFITLRFGLNTFLILMMISIGACEGAVGLGTMIGLTRAKRRQNLE